MSRQTIQMAWIAKGHGQLGENLGDHFMNTERVGRNDPCPCGSGLKYKKCCLGKVPTDMAPPMGDGIDRRIHDAAVLSLEHSEASTIEAISRLEILVEDPGLSRSQKQSVFMSLAQAHQRRGQHRVAIDLLQSLRDEPSAQDDPALDMSAAMLMAVSHNALGVNEQACKLFDAVLAFLEAPGTEPRMLAMANIEAGKAYSQAGDPSRAKECWEAALKYCEGREEEIEHQARVKANLGLLLLHDPDEEQQEQGVRTIEESSAMKRQIGDLDGLANNHCNLAIYFWGKKRYERAIAYMRTDLALSRHVGNLRSLASTLGNLAGLYTELRQLSSARALLREARQIGEDLQDEKLKAISEHGLRCVDQAGREARQQNVTIGPGTECACGSGRQYRDCCGRADFEPEDLDKVMHEMKAAGVEPSRLDFILREPSHGSGGRLAWSRMHMHDGWLEMSELPDMANLHLASAKSLADEAASAPDDICKPLSCVLLSTCAAEAFINQVAFFLHEIKCFPEGKLHSIPRELSADVMAFQRRTELTQKWHLLGEALCGGAWPPPTDTWTGFRNLVFIRNEVVHFKVADYEQVVPPPRDPHEVVKRIPKDVGMRQCPHAWPMRVLTPALASWSVGVVEGMISHFRRGYSRARRGSEWDDTPQQ